MAQTNFSARFISRFLLVAALVFVIGAPLKTSALTITPRMEITTDPGVTIKEIFRVQNEQLQSQTYYVTFANFSSIDETGNPTFTEENEDLATWITAPDTITVGPKETKDIPIQIKVPVNADPGGHFAAIFLQTNPPTNGKITQVAVTAKLGTLVLMRIGSNFEQKGGILEFATKNRQRFFASVPVTFFYRFQNTGDDHLKPLGDIVLTNTIGRTTKVVPANQVDGSVLPKSIRKFEASWTDTGKPLNQEAVAELPTPPKNFWGAVNYQRRNFALGKYKAKIKIVYGTPELKSTNASFTFFIFPWQLLSIAIPSIIVLLIISWLLLKRYNRYIIKRAERGRKQKT